MNWKDEFKQDVLNKGLDLAQSGCVKVNIGEYKIVGEVEDGEDYDVEIEVNDGSVRMMSCNCSAARRHLCQHMAAVMFAFEAESLEFFEEMGHLLDDSEMEIEEILETVDKEDLIECLSFIYNRSDEGKILINVFLQNHFGDYFDGFDNFNLDEGAIDLSPYESSQLDDVLDQYFEVMVLDKPSMEEDFADLSYDGVYYFISELEEAYEKCDEKSKVAIFEWMVNNYGLFQEIDQLDLYYENLSEMFNEDFILRRKFDYLLNHVEHEILTGGDQSHSVSAISALFESATRLELNDVIEDIHSRFKNFATIIEPYIEYLLSEGRFMDAVEELEEECSFLRRISRKDFEGCWLMTQLYFDVGEISTYQRCFETLIKHDHSLDLNQYLQYKSTFPTEVWANQFEVIKNILVKQDIFSQILSEEK